MAKACCSACGRDTAAVVRKLCRYCAGRDDRSHEECGRPVRPVGLVGSPIRDEEVLVYSAAAVYHGGSCRDDI